MQIRFRSLAIAALCFLNSCECQVQQQPTDLHVYERDGWKAAANYLLQGMDESVDPCENFVDFACGNWNASSVQKFGVIDQGQRSRQEIHHHFMYALEKIDLNDPKVPNFKKWLKQFLAACKQMSAKDDVIIRDIYDSVGKYFLPSIALDVNGRNVYPWELDARNDSVFWRFVGTLQRVVNTKFLIKSDLFSYENDNDTTCRQIPTLVLKPNLDLTIRTSMLNIFFKKTLGRYKTPADTRREMTKLKNELRKLHKKSEKSGDSEEELMEVEELMEQVPQIDWQAYFDGLLPEAISSKMKGKRKVNVINVKQFAAADKILKRYDPVVIYNLAYATVTQRYYDLYIEGKFIPLDENVVDVENPIDEENMCSDFAYRYFTAASTRLLMDEYGVTVKQWNNDIELIAETVFSAFQFLVYSIDWMDAEDKVKIVNKVRHIELDFGLPLWLSSDETVNRKTPRFDANSSLVANDILAQRFLYEEQLQPLVTDVFVDSVPSFVENAYYSSEEPSIIINLGNELPPLHRLDYPTAVKYGHTGWTLGHELCHGFDSGGILEGLNFQENNTDWLSDETLSLYKQHERCFVQQHSKFCYQDVNKCVSGLTTIRDNIADVEGLKVAYMAYKFASQLLPKERPLPNLEKYSWDQIFFITAARDYCGLMAVDEDTLKDMHAPPRVRIETANSNFPLFAKAFKCPVGSKYAPIHTCSVWGNYWD